MTSRRSPTRAIIAPALLDGLADAAPGPEGRYETKEAVALAFVSGLQHLAPQQRAVLVLRDVLGFRAEEVSTMLGSSPASVNSALQRARAGLESRDLGVDARDRLSVAGADAELVSRSRPPSRPTTSRRSVALLTEDVIVSMPPQPEWHQGRAAVRDFLSVRHLSRKGPWRFAAANANGQPAYAYYLRDGGVWRRMGMFVVAARADGIASITRFHEFAGLSQFGVARAAARVGVGVRGTTPGPTRVRQRAMHGWRFVDHPDDQPAGTRA